MCLVLGIITVGVLYFIPSVQDYTEPINRGEIVLVPIQPNPVWLENVNLIAPPGEACWGKLYKVPCKDVNASLVSNDPTYYVPPGDRNYQKTLCLQGSVFHFELYNTTGVTAEVWLYDDPDLKDEIKAASGKNCAIKLNGTQCIQLNSSHRFGNITVWVEGKQASYYYWMSLPPNLVTYYVDRYYYDVSSFESYPVDNFTGSYTLHYHEGFQPTNLTSPDVCPFLSINLHSECNTRSITVQPRRRQDILLWPGLVGGFIVLIITAVAVIHFVWFFYKRQKNLPEMLNLQ